MLKFEENYVQKVLEPLNKYFEECSREDFQQSQDYFGLRVTEPSIESRISLLLHIGHKLPADHGEKVYSFISKLIQPRGVAREMVNIDVLIEAKSVWHDVYTVTFKFPEHIKTDEEGLRSVQNLAKELRVEFQTIQYGCMEFSFVMEDIHAHCLPAKILDRKHFDMLQLKKQRPVVTVFGCLAFSPSKDQYWLYFMVRYISSYSACIGYILIII